MHRRWRQHGWETLSVHVAGIKSATVCSLLELEWREEKERRGGSPDEVGVWVAMSPKEENKKGVWYGDESEDPESTGCREKGEAHST